VESAGARQADGNTSDERETEERDDERRGYLTPSNTSTVS
jgi:hypothetical protein